MPTYFQNGNGQRPFKKKYRILSHSQAYSVLFRLNHPQFKQIQTFAKHFSGKKTDLADSVPKFPRKKIKPSSFKSIAVAKTPHQLAQKIRQEEISHIDPSSESHLGGGLLDAFNTATSWAYNTLTQPAVNWMHDLLGHEDTRQRISQTQGLEANTLEQAYNKPNKRADNINGWNLLPEYNTDYVAVYQNPETQNIHVAVRGSKTVKDWGYHDVGIALENRPGTQETEDIQNQLVQIAERYPENDLTVNTHSLSGSFIMNAFRDATAEETQWLDHYEEINLFNPGSSPFVNTGDISRFIRDPRVHLFLNKTDLISATYGELLPEGYDRVIWGQETVNPLEAHTYRQWMTTAAPRANNNYIPQFNRVHTAHVKHFEARHAAVATPTQNVPVGINPDTPAIDQGGKLGDEVASWFAEFV